MSRYYSRIPAEVIWTDACFGEKPEGYDDLFIFVPEMRQVIRIAAGTIDDLSPEDFDQGYVDCIRYEQYELSVDIPEVGRDWIMLEEGLRERYKCIADCIPDVLSMAYGSYMYDCMILA